MSVAGLPTDVTSPTARRRDQAIAFSLFHGRWMMAIDIGSVEPGDLIFTYDAADLANPGTPTGHVMLVGAEDKAGVVTQIHQVRKSMANQNSGTQRERLIPNTPKAPGVSGSRKRVLRCKNRALAQRAAKQALYWQRWFQLEFSEDRITNATFFEKKFSSETVARLREHFETTGKYRAIKYAARREGFLCYPDEEGESGKGMFCSMFVVICYQVAGLEDYVKPAKYTDTMLRISDKKMSPDDCRKVKAKLVTDNPSGCGDLEFQRYESYTQKLKEANPYGLDHFEESEPGARRKKLVYRPSIEYWDFAKGSISSANWAGIVTAGMMVDAKVVMPRGLYDSLAADGDGWEDLGDLTGAQKFEAADDVKARATNLLAESALRRQSWVKGRVV